MKCKICQSAAGKLFNAKVLAKYSVDYYACASCGFIQTEAPYWLDEAYSSAITKLDIGLLSRNLTLKPIVAAIIHYFFDPRARFMDYGGGYGVLVRMMRDIGFDFYRQDLFCDNLFASNFDVSDHPTLRDFELLTAFEVFEHLNDPLHEVEKMLRYSDSILFSTELVPGRKITPDNWWYVAPETGQHIAFYTRSALEYIAQTYNLNLYSNNVNLHLFTKKKIKPSLFSMTVNYRMAKVLNLAKPRLRSLLDSDFQLLRNTINQSNL